MKKEKKPKKCPNCGGKLKEIDFCCECGRGLDDLEFECESCYSRFDRDKNEL